MAITYAIDGGADAAKFNIDGTTGKLTFKAVIAGLKKLGGNLAAKSDVQILPRPVRTPDRAIPQLQVLDA